MKLDSPWAQRFGALVDLLQGDLPVETRWAARGYNGNAGRAGGSMAGREWKGETVRTVGHSTRSWEVFLSILKKHGVERIVDVRTIPRSRRHPQFNQDELAGRLKEAGIDYVHLKELGGLRHARPNSQNTGWRNDSFRGYADYMQTEEFEAALQRLLQLAVEKRNAVMCAEAVPWRCHRSLIGDALIARNISVEHILSETQTEPHRLTPFAKVNGINVSYPGPEKIGAEDKGSLPLFDGNAAEPRDSTDSRRRKRK